MKLSDAKYTAILPLLLEGLESAVIMTTIGCGASTVSAALRRARAEGHSIALARKTRGKSSDDYPPNVDWIRRLRLAESLLISGATIDRIASACSCSQKSARRMLTALEQLGVVVIEKDSHGKATIFGIDPNTRVFVPLM